MPLAFPPLPILPALPELARALGEQGAAVLQAPPGAGKTTIVPLALLDQPWLDQRQILMLEPRRLAARAAATRMASLLGEGLGATVGYRIRRDSRVGPATRIQVVTEGILTRMLQHDPALDAAGLVIFDEFHERSLHADLGLALTLESRQVLRPDLRLLVMSATLEGHPVARLLGGAPIITSEGRSHAVETRYLPRRPETRIEAAVASAVRDALAREEGDILVFLPGQGEIRRTADLLEGGRGWSVHQLYGNLTQSEQDAAIRAAPVGQRKVVLATAIAETSLTIEGVRVVVDSGLARVPRYSAGSGMTRLTTVRVSRASADQRRGRAGRTAPGVCYRLWPEMEDSSLLPRPTPEILESDLAGLALELAVHGVRDPARLRWLDAPPFAALTEARSLLAELGALDRTGGATSHGRRMAELGAHPRIAHLLLQGAALGALSLAAPIAALLEERDPLRGDGAPVDADLELRLDLVSRPDLPPVYHSYSVDRGAVQRIREGAREWRRLITAAEQQGSGGSPTAGVLLALAYPDRVGQLRPGSVGRFLLRNGQGVVTDSPTLARSDYLVAADLDGERRESWVRLGATLTESEVESLFESQFELEESVTWDDAVEGVIAVERVRLGAIIIRERPIRHPDSSLIQATLLDWLRRVGLGALDWTDEARAVRARLGFVHQLRGAPWPDVSDSALLSELDRWLGPDLVGFRRRADLPRLKLGSALLRLLDREQRRALEDLAPTHLVVPSGSRIELDYSDPAAPALPVRLQEVFGWTDTPRLGGGQVPVTLRLLSPAGRTVQVTKDLAGFWETSYFDVRKEMRGRYPKHDWPEDPRRAMPTRRRRRQQ
ncbi:MAG TPA: ATP-dependent helicase HrpB [Gemmatimonadales bacterium]|nr:ATP-dependent helicase HrpB [Gemmatimonadales bacterium]